MLAFAHRQLRCAMDIMSPSERSTRMSLIKGVRNASTELRVVATLRSLSITGWRREAVVFGKPDFVFPKLKLAVFVDGCFWHACPIHATQPKQHTEFWRAKIARNVARDRLVTRTLRARGWRVMRIWEHELTRKYERRLLTRLRHYGLLPTPLRPESRLRGSESG